MKFLLVTATHPSNRSVCAKSAPFERYPECLRCCGAEIHMDSAAARIATIFTKTCCSATRSAALHNFSTGHVVKGAQERQLGNDSWPGGSQCRPPCHPASPSAAARGAPSGAP